MINTAQGFNFYQFLELTPSSLENFHNNSFLLTTENLQDFQ